MNARNRQRGQPLLFLATILGGWTIMRVMLWTSPFPAVAPLLADEERAGGSSLDLSIPATASSHGQGQVPGAVLGRDAGEPWPEPTFDAPAPLSSDPRYDPIAPAWSAEQIAEASSSDARDGTPARTMASHYMLLASGMSNMALPPEIAAFYGRGSTPATGEQRLAVADRPLLGQTAAAPQVTGRPSRWSADGWLMWREGSGAAGVPGAAFYGRSQAGAVVRYRLGPALRAPAAYVRGSHALEGPAQREVALGVSARPLRDLPVRIAAEARVSDAAGRREVRPAAFAVTELAPLALPLGLRGEAYVQGGYVGGRDATAFVDGQARVDRKVFRVGGDEAELRAGLAAWGGAQKGAARLDIGPTASLGFRLGDARSRLAVDYRFRVAGEAEPKSGPAVTLSAGF